jgi:hypothetical protein
MASIKSAIPLHRTCKQATHLMLAQEDKPLRTRDKLALNIHLWICKNCPRFQRQLESMSRSLSDWRNEMKK